MLIINKKFTDLLQGYKTAVALDQKLRSEWENEIKPAVLASLQLSDEQNLAAYQNALKLRDEAEALSIEKWEQEGIALEEQWNTREELLQEQNRLKNLEIQRTNDSNKAANSRKRRNFFLIAGACMCCVPLNCFLGFLFSSSKTFGGLSALSILPVVILPQIAIALVIVALIAFRNSNPILFRTYTPQPRPWRGYRSPNLRPEPPNKKVGVLQTYTSFNLVNEWLYSIQYDNFGEEHFIQLAIDSPDSIPGIPGEKSLLYSFRPYLSAYNSTYDGIAISLLGVLCGFRDDIDNIFINDTGIWILDSKYMKGKIKFSQGKWQHFVMGRAEGQDQWIEKLYSKPLEMDTQWNRQLANITGFLRIQLTQYPWLVNAIRGGLVFTHPKLDSLDIAFSSAKGYPTQQWMLEIFNHKEDILDFTLEKRLEVVDAILTGTRRFENKPAISAISVAEEIYNKAHDNLVNYQSSILGVQN